MRGSILSQENRLIKCFMAAGILAGLAILFAVPPADLPFPACAFQSVTGHSCMTCGLTRSLHAVSHGELAASLRWHLFGPGVFAAMLLGLVVFATEAISGRASAIRLPGKVRSRILIALPAVWFFYWCTRLLMEL